MTSATINDRLNRDILAAQRAFQQAGVQLPGQVQQLGQRLGEVAPAFASAASRTFPITEAGIGQAGSADRFVSGIVSGQLGPAIRDAGLNAISTGAIAGGLQAAFNGADLRGAFEGAVTGALNNAIASSGIGDALNNAAAQLGVTLPPIPGIPALGGAAGGLAGASPSGASGGAAAAARSGVTRSGTLATTEPAPARTSIQDPAAQDVTITVDSFLQGLQGSLSSLPGGIGGLINGALNQLLSSTGLSGALGGLVSGLSEGLGNAMAGLTSALGNAAQGLMQGLGNAIQSIPGVGPALTGMTNAIGNFAGNISSSFDALPTAAQAGINGAIAAVGSNVINRLDIPGLPKIPPAAAGIATAAITFAENPASQLVNIASAARTMDKTIRKETRDTTFANIASAATRAAKEMEKNTVRNTDGSYSLVKDPDDAAASVDKTQVVQDGQLTSVTNSFVDNLNDVQLQSYETYARIIRSRFAPYGNNTPDVAVQAYNEYIEFGNLRTPETRLLVNSVKINDANQIKQLADRFLVFYRSDKSRYTLDNL